MSGRGAFPRSARSIRRPSAWSARSAISTGWSPRARRICVPGSTTAGGRAAAARRRRRCGGAGAPYAFLPAEGESLHQIPVGPVHAGIIEPGHFRFTASGETVVRLEERLGYVHKGIEEADGRRRSCSAARSSPGGPPATARSPTRSPSRAPPRRRWNSSRRRALTGCAR